MRLLGFIFLFFIIDLACFGQQSWTTTLSTIGSFSSPRVSDLNNDGVKDIIMGGGRLEFQACDTAMFALDGRSGEMLWNVAAVDQIFGSAAFLDIDGDQVMDPILNGRSSELKAISGRTGQVIWAFDTVRYSNNGIKRWFNFYNAQLIHDVDQDGLLDLLVSNGGDVLVEAYDERRAPGRLVIISSRNGSLLAEAQMPDNREIYQSIVVSPNFENPKQSKVYYGTGGETIDGSFFVGSIQMVLDGDLSNSVELSNGEGKGFIAPPVLVDITNDSILDAVVCAVNGRILAFDGASDKLLWQQKILDTEVYATPAVGKFNTDETPDFFISVAQGTWPDLSWLKQAMINGENGEIEFMDSLGYYQTSSPLALDIDADGMDEIVISLDLMVLDSIQQKEFYNTLYAIRFESNEVLPMMESSVGHNVSSTPWLGDLEGDGLLDMVFCHGVNKYETYTFDGLQVNCVKTTIPIKTTIKWGSYMGSSYDGIYRK